MSNPAANRRKFERYYLENELQAFVVLHDNTEVPIVLIEISQGGFSFRIASRSCSGVEDQISGHLAFKLLVTPSSYLHHEGTIAHCTPSGNQLRFGVCLDFTLAAHDAYRAWVVFFALFIQHGRLMADTSK